MQIVNYTEFRNDLDDILNRVYNNNEIVVVSSSKGKGAVVMSLEEYNSINETLHLIGSEANQVRLDAAITEMRCGISTIEDWLPPSR